MNKNNMKKVQLITSKDSNRFQHVKWLLNYLEREVEIINYSQLKGLKSENQEVRNPTLVDHISKEVIQGENAIMTYIVLEATKDVNNKTVPSKERTLLGYKTADVLQIESLLEILTEIQRFALDCIIFSNLKINVEISEPYNLSP